MTSATQVGSEAWCRKEEEEVDLWECAVLESAVAAAAAAEMESFEHEMEEDQPLDLSMKPRSPTPRVARPDGKHHGQDSPLCLIKDCGCNNHGPKARALGGASIYDCGKYGPPTGDLATEAPLMRYSGPESLESRSVDGNHYEARGACYPANMPRPDMCSQNAGNRPWDSRRIPSEDERMDTSLEHARFDEISSVAQSRYKLPFRTCVNNETEQPGVNYRTTPKFYDNCDQNPQSVMDLNASGCKRDNIWRPPVNNEERYRLVGRPWGEDSNPSSRWGWSNRAYYRSDSYPSQSHWRPFAENTEVRSAAGRSQPPSRETLKSINTEPTAQHSKSIVSGAVKTSAPIVGSKVQPSNGSSSLPPSRNMCHSFASTVPLITSSSVPASRETQSLPSTPSSGSPLVIPRVPYTTIRVTRSPKTFHNEAARGALDADSRGCPFKRPQDCGRRFPPGKGSQGKENIDLTDKGLPDSEAPAVGVKMPALDYLISKVLVERIDIPFKPCNTEIKKIYNGESKGRLRLVDLIELQVEESLKA